MKIFPDLFEARCWIEESKSRLISKSTLLCIADFDARQDSFTLDGFEVAQGSGSGFVWDKDGNIVTNYHVICGASDLRAVTMEFEDLSTKSHEVEKEV